MRKYTDEEQELARKLITEEEASAMMRCICYQNMNDASYYKPHLNGWVSTDSEEIKAFNNLVDKGYVLRSDPVYPNCDLRQYSVTLAGLDVLSAYLKVYIFATNTLANFRSYAKDDVLKLMVDQAKIDGATEMKTKHIAEAARIPQELAGKSLRTLTEEGYVKRTGHGWILTDKAFE